MSNLNVESISWHDYNKKKQDNRKPRKAKKKEKELEHMDCEVYFNDKPYSCEVKDTQSIDYYG